MASIRRTARAALVSAIAVATAAVFAGSASAAETHAGRAAAPAVFVQSDNVAGNTVVAYSRSADGSLHQSGVYPTGGLGGALTGSVADHLASQGSLTYDAKSNRLFAVNAGSDTVTVFAVRGDHLQRLQVLPSGGDFPVSIAVHGHQVYVLNALDGGSVQGYVQVGGNLVKVPSWHRDLSLGSTADLPFVQDPGQVGFTPDGSKLVVTTKAATSAIDVLPLNRLGAPGAPVANVEPGAVPFAFTFDRSGHLVVAQAGTNSIATYTVHADGSVSAVDQQATGQAATCWVVTVPTAKGDLAYTSNAGSGSLSGYRIHEDGALTSLGDTGTDAGTVDVTVSSDGRTLYAQTGGAGIVDAFHINQDGSLTRTASVTVPGAVGGGGIAASRPQPQRADTRRGVRH
jgi:6-phosphogluconolactonase (cycloisomerase 2 family)